MSHAQARPLARTFGALQIAIIVLVIITAIIHLQRGLGFVMGGGGQGGPPPGGGGGQGGGQGGGFGIMQLLPLPLPVLFLLNGIGYLVLVVGLYLPALRNYQSIIRWLLIIFTAVTVIMYFAIAGLRMNPIGLFDKLVEIALIVLLFIEGRRASSPTGEALRM